MSEIDRNCENDIFLNEKSSQYNKISLEMNNFAENFYENLNKLKSKIIIEKHLRIFNILKSSTLFSIKI